MTPEGWQKIKEVFDAAAERLGGERTAYLDEACRDDAELRREVETLLAADEGESSFMQRPAVSEVMHAMAEGNGQLAVGRKIGRYAVLSLLGRGGMGEVYLARDTRIGRKVALKLLSSEFVQNRDRLRRFRQEAFAASSLNHPNIMTVYEVDEHDGVPFIASEYVEGVTLREHMSGRVLKIMEALDIAAQVAAALSAAHEAGVVHRDVKPENVMLRRDGYVKVLDFGLAKLAQAATGEQASGLEASTQLMVNTEPGMVMGTVAYMSPEQAQGVAVDVRTDIWSLGVVLYEMLSGHVPFEGSTTSHVIVSILEKEPLPLAQCRPEALEETAKQAGKDPVEMATDLLRTALLSRRSFTERSLSEALEGHVGVIDSDGTPEAQYRKDAFGELVTKKLESQGIKKP